jgi:hypothetical protein
MIKAAIKKYFESNLVDNEIIAVEQMNIDFLIPH